MISDVCFKPGTDHLLVSSSDDHVVKIWDTREKRSILDVRSHVACNVEHQFCHQHFHLASVAAFLNTCTCCLTSIWAMSTLRMSPCRCCNKFVQRVS
jgi:WD40 repeat protein